MGREFGVRLINVWSLEVFSSIQTESRDTDDCATRVGQGLLKRGLFASLTTFTAVLYL